MTAYSSSLIVMRSLNDVAMGVCHRMFILIMNFPGVPTACSLFSRMFDIIHHALHLTSRKDVETPRIPHKSSSPTLQREAYMGDPSCTYCSL